MKVSPVDVLNAIYLSMVTLIVIAFHERIDEWYRTPLLFVVYGLAIAAILLSRRRWPGSRALRFFHRVYSLFALPFLYKNIEKYVLVFHGHFLDAGMNTWERRLFGVYPNLYLEQFVSRPMTEFMMATYFSYYLYVIVPPLILFGQNRDVALERYVFSILFTFYACYLGFLLVPVLGPILSLKHSFARPDLTGYVFAPLQGFIMEHGDPMGTCFPSSHVAVAWAGILSMRHCFGKKTFWSILPATICLTVAVVYNRYHYLSDAIAGLATAVICNAVCLRVFRSTSLSRRHAGHQSERDRNGALTTA
jgi:membrane-associated phospholipid phosphatase